MITAIHKSLAAKREAVKNNEDKGFTLIELLVVVLIIGILAAIAIPVFLGQQNQAKDSATKSDLSNAKLAMVAYATANSGVYLTSTSPAYGTTLANYGYVTSDGVGAATISAASTAAGVFCISALSGSGTTYKITNTAGAVSGACP